MSHFEKYNNYCLISKHGFSVFHKPFHTDITIHNSSVHPDEQKLSAFNSKIHRLVSINQTKDNFNNELNNTIQIELTVISETFAQLGKKEVLYYTNQSFRTLKKQQRYFV